MFSEDDLIICNIYIALHFHTWCGKSKRSRCPIRVKWEAHANTWLCVGGYFCISRIFFLAPLLTYLTSDSSAGEYLLLNCCFFEKKILCRLKHDSNPRLSGPVVSPYMTELSRMISDLVQNVLPSQIRRTFTPSQETTPSTICPRIRFILYCAFLNYSYTRLDN